MSELTLKHTELVSKYILRQEIVFSHLPDDLVDHICCDIEDMMKKGISFEEAFSEIKLMIGVSGLRKIQEETLIAIDSKYRKMKRTMKISGVTGTVLFGLSTLFKIMHLPFAGMMLLAGALLIIALFLPSSLMVLWKESKSRKRIFFFISAFLASSLVIAGVIFRIQHWPGTGLILSIGIITAITLVIPSMVAGMINNPERVMPEWIIIAGAVALSICGAGFLLKFLNIPLASLLIGSSTLFLSIIVIPAYFYSRWGKDENVSVEAIIIVAALAIFLVPVHLINFSASQNFDESFISSSNLTKKSLEFRISRNEWLISNITSPGDGDIENLHKETKQLLERIEKIQTRLYEPGLAEATAFNNMDETESSGSFNYQATLSLFSPPETLLEDLEEDLKSYRDNITMIYDGSRLNSVTGTLDLKLYMPHVQEESGQNIHLAPVAFHQGLDLLKESVLDAEAEVIRNTAIENNQK